jgi:hypothetical protein
VYQQFAQPVVYSLWQHVRVAWQGLKRLYKRYDGSTIESCVREIVEAKAALITVGIAFSFYIVQLLSLLSYMAAHGNIRLSHAGILTPLQLCLYPALIPALVCVPIYIRLYRRLRQASVCFSCKVPFRLVYVSKQDLLDRSRASERLQSNHMAVVRLRQPPLFTPEKHAICLECGSSFRIV